MSTRVRAHRALGAVFATVMLSTIGAGCGASPEDVCSHIEEVVEKESGEAAAKEAIDGCERTWKIRNDTKSVFEYKELADCVTDAEDLEALAKCK